MARDHQFHSDVQASPLFEEVVSDQKEMSNVQLRWFEAYEYSDDEVLELSIGREELLQEILDRLERVRDETLGHEKRHIFVYGPRGIGKSFLVRNLEAELARTQVQTKFVRLPEEILQRTPIALVSEITSHLLDQDSSHNSSRKVDDEGLWAESLDRLEQALEVMNSPLVVVSMENVNNLFQKREFRSARGSERMDELLTRFPTLVFFATATTNPGDIKRNYVKTGFHQTRLEPWSAQNFVEFVQSRIGYSDHETTLTSKIRALAEFTGGYPRIAVVLTEILSDPSKNDSAISLLDRLVDRITPYYQNKVIDRLSEYQQELLQMMVKGGEPCSQSELADRLHVQPNLISRDFQILQSEGLVAGNRTRRFSVADRLFAYFFRKRYLRRSKGMEHELVQLLAGFHQGQLVRMLFDGTDHGEKGATSAVLPLLLKNADQSDFAVKTYSRASSLSRLLDFWIGILEPDLGEGVVNIARDTYQTIRKHNVDDNVMPDHENARSEVDHMFLELVKHARFCVVPDMHVAEEAVTQIGHLDEANLPRLPKICLHQFLANFQFLDGDIDAAITSCNQAIDLLRPNEHQLKCYLNADLMLFFNRLEDLPNLEPEFVSSLEGHAQGLYQLGYHYFRVGYLKKSEQMYQQALKKVRADDPTMRGSIEYNLSWHARENGRSDEAKEWILKSIDSSKQGGVNFHYLKPLQAYFFYQDPDDDDFLNCANELLEGSRAIHDRKLEVSTLLRLAETDSVNASYAKQACDKTFPIASSDDFKLGLRVLSKFISNLGDQAVREENELIIEYGSNLFDHSKLKLDLTWLVMGSQVLSSLIDAAAYGMKFHEVLPQIERWTCRPDRYDHYWWLDLSELLDSLADSDEVRFKNVSESFFQCLEEVLSRDSASDKLKARLRAMIGSTCTGLVSRSENADALFQIAELVEKTIGNNTLRDVLIVGSRLVRNNNDQLVDVDPNLSNSVRALRASSDKSLEENSERKQIHLDAHIGVRIADSMREASDFPSKPPLPGAWTTLKRSEAVEVTLAAYAFAAGQNLRDYVLNAIGVPDKIGPLTAEALLNCHGVRKLSLPFYDGWDLFQFIVRSPETELFGCGDEVFSCLINQDDIVPLLGTSPNIKLVNQKSLKLNAMNVRDYARFFCNTLFADSGAFNIVESGDDLVHLKLDQDLRDRIDEVVHPIRILGEQESPNESSVGWKLSATMLYANVLFETHLFVPKDGVVDMTFDEPIMEDIPNVPVEIVHSGLRFFKNEVITRRALLQEQANY